MSLSSSLPFVFFRGTRRNKEVHPTSYTNSKILQPPRGLQVSSNIYITFVTVLKGLIVWLFVLTLLDWRYNIVSFARSCEMGQCLWVCKVWWFQLDGKLHQHGDLDHAFQHNSSAKKNRNIWFWMNLGQGVPFLWLLTEYCCILVLISPPSSWLVCVWEITNLN